MSATLQPHLRIGIAVAGAGAIALAPVMQPMPDITQPLARSVSTASVALSAATNPIEQWLQIVNTAIANGGALAESYLDNPAPILRQLIVNGVGYVEQTSTAVQTTVTSLIDNLRFDNPNGLPANLKNAWDQVLAGDVAAGLQAMYGAVSGYLLLSAFPLINLLEIPKTMAQNFANAVDAGLQGVVGLAFGALSMPAAAVEATSVQIQAVVDAFQAGNVLAAINEVFAIPGAFVGGLVNGYGFNAGLLSPDGLVDMALRALNSIAVAIGAAPPATSMVAPRAAEAADLGPSALPADPSTVATVVVHTADGGTDDEPAAASEGAESTEGTADATATEPVAEEPAAEDAGPEEPDTAEPDVTEPVAAEPDVTEPDAAEPVLTEPISTDPTDAELGAERKSFQRGLKAPKTHASGGELRNRTDRSGKGGSTESGESTSGKGGSNNTGPGSDSSRTDQGGGTSGSAPSDSAA